MATHEVLNQAPPLVDVNLFRADRALRDALAAQHPDHAAADFDALGAFAGSAEGQELARLANQNPPRLQQFDAQGRRVDEVEFHPAWHALMRRLVASGVHADPWERPRPGAQVDRAARYLLFSQLENGSQCPVTMTYASVPVLQRLASGIPAIAAHWLPKVLSREYDARSAPVERKSGALVGMGMTEKQGGSDVRANTTRAEHVGTSVYGEEYRLTGHKWFFSAPQCDAHLVLAQADPGSPAGLSCFLLPRWLPDGTRNAVRVQRLKDKVGNRSNASSEVEFDRAIAWLVGEVGRGVPTILEMGTHTRLDCAIGSAGQMRAVVAMAIAHACGRRAFGRLLIEQPLMRSVLADLALESEAATALALRLARTFDDRTADPRQEALCRVLTPAAKYWICKRGPMAGAEAMEVLGGNGYVEDSTAGRFYRELPVNSIWEGSGNVMCLDVLRALARTPGCREALESELARAKGLDRRYDAWVADLRSLLAAGDPDEASARRLVARIALAAQAATLLTSAPSAIADGFCASRLSDGSWGQAFGTLPPGIDVAAILERARPVA
jgi:putative acyl-CoA dehydrogenase